MLWEQAGDTRHRLLIFTPENFRLAPTPGRGRQALAHRPPRLPSIALFASVITSSPIHPGPYLADLLAQPAVLADVSAELADTVLPADLVADLNTRAFRRIVLTGMGSSLHSLYPLHLRLSAAGFSSWWIETSELLLGFGPMRASDTLLIVVSQSGESAEVVNLMRGAKDFGCIVAVTNAPTSTLARAAQVVLPLRAGVEATVSCKTYLATLAVLHWLGAALTGDDISLAARELEAAQPLVARYLDQTPAHVDELLPLVAGVTSVFVTGRGASLATAGAGGLILKESTRQPAEGMSCAAFRHGPLEMVNEHVLVVVFSGDARVEPLHRRLAADVSASGGKVAFVSATAPSAAALRLPAVAEGLRPLVEILPVQMLSLAVAARDGREAGRFERASKITTVE